MTLQFTNTLTRTKEPFVPIDEKNVRMYVCGPTVYDFAHIGNARPVVVFDVLFRLLRHIYGEDHVTYVRNITDVDDKINARALRDYPDLPLNDAIAHVTEKTTNQFHADIAALGCMEPTHEPRATQHIGGMISMIEGLIDKGHAYVAAGEVLFDTASMPNYGALSKRNLDEQKAGARIAVDDHKKNPGDFVLWKLSSAEEPGWESPWGRGRPGWHIECSVMSAHHLGETFDIHGGGLDLIFPHHENEIAQSCCAHGTDTMANTWLHNGFVQVEGRKMSKSEGNFVTIHEAMKRTVGDVIRYHFLKTNYRKPLDFTEIGLLKSAQELRKLAEAAFETASHDRHMLDAEFLSHLTDDLDTPGALNRLSAMAKAGGREAGIQLASALEFLGFRHWRTSNAYSTAVAAYGVPDQIMQLGIFWKPAYLNSLSGELQHLTQEAAELGWGFEWRDNGLAFQNLNEGQSSEDEVQKKVTERLTHIAQKNWAEADRIRDELAEKGIQLKDGKDPETGERVTTWEVKR